jgi:hypothetical protein
MSIYHICFVMATPINQLPLPNTHANGLDMDTEDAATIAEVMNHFTTTPPHVQQQQHVVNNNQPQLPPVQHYAQPQQQQFVQTPMPAAPQQMVQMAPAPAPLSPPWFDMNDLKASVLIAGIVFAIVATPFASFLSKYFPLDKLPYSDTMIKSLVAAVVLVLTRKYMD